MLLPATFPGDCYCTVSFDVQCFYRATHLWSGICYGPVSVSPSVCPSNTRRYCIETSERIKMVFVTEDSLSVSCVVFCENSGISKNKGNFCHLFPNYRFFCFYRGASTIASVVSFMRPSQRYHTERPPLLITRGRDTERRAVCQRQLRPVGFNKQITSATLTKFSAFTHICSVYKQFILVAFAGQVRRLSGKRRLVVCPQIFEVPLWLSYWRDSKKSVKLTNGTYLLYHSGSSPQPARKFYVFCCRQVWQYCRLSVLFLLRVYSIIGSGSGLTTNPKCIRLRIQIQVNLNRGSPRIRIRIG